MSFHQNEYACFHWGDAKDDKNLGCKDPQIRSLLVEQFRSCERKDMLYPITLFEGYYVPLQNTSFASLNLIQRFRAVVSFSSKSDALFYFSELSGNERYRFFHREIYFMDNMGDRLSGPQMYRELYPIRKRAHENVGFRDRPVPGLGRRRWGLMYRNPRQRGYVVEHARMQESCKEYGIRVKRPDIALLKGVFDDFTRGRQPKRSWKEHRKRQYR